MGIYFRNFEIIFCDDSGFNERNVDIILLSVNTLMFVFKSLLLIARVDSAKFTRI